VGVSDRSERKVEPDVKAVYHTALLPHGQILDAGVGAVGTAKVE
jgi:hypothetical protein